MASYTVQARALYRRFLRELPSRPPSILANPSPIQQHIRADIASSERPPTPSQKQLETSAEAIKRSAAVPSLFTGPARVHHPAGEVQSRDEHGRGRPGTVDGAEGRNGAAGRDAKERGW